MATRYEIMYIINPETTSLQRIQEKLHGILTTDGGKIDSVDDWGVRNFPFEVEKKIKGHYFVLKTTSSSSHIAEFKRIAGIETDVMRVFTLNIDNEKNYSDEKVVFKERENDGKSKRYGRDDRGDRPPRKFNHQSNYRSSQNREKK